MEFKGTKGKWIIAQNNVNIWADNTKVANCDNNSQASMYRIKDEEEMKYNALLISKAPEMLEMLKELVKSADDMFNNGEPSETYYQLINKTEKIIKEATEL